LSAIRDASAEAHPVLAVIEFLKRDALLQKRHLISLAMQPLGIREQSIEVKNQRADSHFCRSLPTNFTGFRLSEPTQPTDSEKKARLMSQAFFEYVT